MSDIPINVDDVSVMGTNSSDRFLVSVDLTGPMTIDGKGGDDTFDAQGVHTVGDAVTFQGVENLALDASLLTMSVGDLGSFTTILADTGAIDGELALTVSGTTFANLSVLGLETLNVQASSSSENLFFSTPLGSTPTNITLAGNAGNDVLDTGDGNDVIYGNENNDTVDGNGGSDKLFGGNDNDTMIVRDGDIFTRGNDNDDTFIITEGTIHTGSLEGGSGTDTLRGADAGAGPWIIDGSVGVSGFEKLALDFDVIQMAGSQLADFDTIIQDGSATTGELNLSSGGTATTDVIGLTTLLMNTVGDFTDVYNLTFTTSGAIKTDITVEGANAFDTLTTGDGDDTLFGFDGNDTFVGHGGNDTYEGGTGEDLVSYADAGIGVDVSLKITTAQFLGSLGSDTLHDIEWLKGSAFADTLTGNGVGNRLYGGAGADTLSGLNGNDRLFGEHGDDTLTGGSGIDRFTFANGGGSDTVTDFTNGTDLLSFEGFGTAFDTAAEIIAAATTVNGNTQITLPNPGAGNTVVTLTGFSLANLDASDFDSIIA